MCPQSSWYIRFQLPSNTPARTPQSAEESEKVSLAEELEQVSLSAELLAQMSSAVVTLSAAQLA